MVNESHLEVEETLRGLQGLSLNCDGDEQAGNAHDYSGVDKTRSGQFSSEAEK